MTDSRSPSEPDRAAILRIRLAGVAALVAAGLLLALLGGGTPGERLFDLYQRSLPRDLSQTRVAAVMIDAESLREVGPWPWPRYTLARLAERIAADGAVAIGFDMIFAESDWSAPARFVAQYPELSDSTAQAIRALPSGDAALAAVLGRTPSVLARLGVAGSSAEAAGTVHADPAMLPVEAQITGRLGADILSWPRALASIADFEEVAHGQGLINGPLDADGVVRRVPLVARVAGVATPGFALDVARVARGGEAIAAHLSRGRLAGLEIGGRVLPVDRGGRMRLHFGNLPSAATIPAIDLLRRRSGPSQLAGKAVLIGLAGAGTADIVATPLAPETFGVLVQAQAVDAILTGSALARPDWTMPLEWVLALLLAGIAIVALPGRPIRAALGPVALGLLVLGGSWLLFAYGATLVDPVPALVLGGSTAAALIAASSAESARAQVRLANTLEQERLTAAKAAGELDAARDIQRGMLPDHASLAGLHAGLEIDALLEPAQSVGGDFYDGVRLRDGRVGFLVGDVTGKGVPAALFMALCKALAKGALLRGRELDAIVTDLGHELATDNAETMFVTLLIGIADPVDGVIELTSAGHENPILMGPLGPRDLSIDGGPPLGAVDDFPYGAERVRLAPGEGLVVVTDGVTEAQSPAGAFFGRARVLEVLSGLGPDWNAATACTALANAVRDFEAGGAPSDDLTVLAIRWTGGTA